MVGGNEEESEEEEDDESERLTDASFDAKIEKNT